MNDSKVSMTATFAWISWALSGVFLAAAWLASGDVHTTTEGMVLCSLAIIAAAAAATFHTRSFFCAFACRFLSAYEIGRDRGRIEERERMQVPLQRVH